MPALRRIALLMVAAAASAVTPSCQHEYEPYHAEESARVLELGGKKVAVEIAKDQASRNRGLMFRKSIPADHGMLFIYPEARILGFWMQNTAIPLSIAFIEEVDASTGRIVNIEEMQPFVEAPTTVAKRPVRLALEMNQGWFARHGIKAGDTIPLPSWVGELVAAEDRE